jgi:hypothetical protein
MKSLTIMFCALCSAAYGQLTMDSLNKIVQPYHLGYSSYFAPFVGKTGYGAPWILTSDGGGAGFGDNVMHKFDKRGKETWKREVKAQFNGETEGQVMAQDTKGNFYLFLLQYNPKGYRGGAERVVCYDKTGKFLWDKILGKFSALNNPIVSYVKPAEDGKIYMRGHMAKEQAANGDPKYLFWEGWIDATGKLTQKTGEEIDWAKSEWQAKFKPE